jgi:hypothetical protein
VRPRGTPTGKPGDESGSTTRRDGPPPRGRRRLRSRRWLACPSRRSREPSGHTGHGRPLRAAHRTPCLHRRTRPAARLPPPASRPTDAAPRWASSMPSQEQRPRSVRFAARCVEYVASSLLGLVPHVARRPRGLVSSKQERGPRSVTRIRAQLADSQAPLGGRCERRAAPRCVAYALSGEMSRAHIAMQPIHSHASEGRPIHVVRRGRGPGGGERP